MKYKNKLIKKLDNLFVLSKNKRSKITIGSISKSSSKLKAIKYNKSTLSSEKVNVNLNLKLANQMPNGQAYPKSEIFSKPKKHNVRHQINMTPSSNTTLACKIQLLMLKDIVLNMPITTAITSGIFIILMMSLVKDILKRLNFCVLKSFNFLKHN